MQDVFLAWQGNVLVAVFSTLEIAIESWKTSYRGRVQVQKAAKVEVWYIFDDQDRSLGRITREALLDRLQHF